VDKRYVDILANYTPWKTSKWLRGLGYVAFFLVIAGAFLLANATYKPVDTQAGRDSAFMVFTIGAVTSMTGLIVIGVGLYLKNRERRRAKERFLDYFEKNQTLPPWPEDNKKTTSSPPDKTVN
jgi:hypothetical protein